MRFEGVTFCNTIPDGPYSDRPNDVDALTGYVLLANGDEPGARKAIERWRNDKASREMGGAIVVAPSRCSRCGRNLEPAYGESVSASLDHCKWTVTSVENQRRYSHQLLRNDARKAGKPGEKPM